MENSFTDNLIYLSSDCMSKFISMGYLFDMFPCVFVDLGLTCLYGSVAHKYIIKK